MVDSVTLNPPVREDWLQQLADVVTEPEELLRLLALETQQALLLGKKAKTLFPLRVPRGYIQKMAPGDPNDPLLLQVITDAREFTALPGYSTDPLVEQANAVPGLLRKYKNRALMLLKGGCAIHCRYCFRRHFPYQANPGNKKGWQAAIDHLRLHPELDEIILSGGDPLMAQDHELAWLIQQLETLPQLKRLRIHSRLVSVIPARLTATLCALLARSRLQIILVTHINHANEIDDELCQRLQSVKRMGITLLNQSVLLRKINDSAAALIALSQALLDAGILPYYLHLLDKVQGAAHFHVSDRRARALMRDLMANVSGYMVPKLVREIGGEPNKTMLDLNLKEKTDI